MKPYHGKQALRPGCACCNNKTFDKYSARKSQSVKNAQRAGKKRARVFCPDCGEQGEVKGHMTCQYPQD